MGLFFEINIPKKAPAYMKPGLAARYEAVADRLYKRFDKVNQAHALSKLRGEDFQRAISPLFDTHGHQNSILEEMDVEQIAAFAQIAAKNKEPAPSRYEWPNAGVVVDTAFVYNDEWECLRCLGIGGSEASVVMGVSKWNSPKDLYHLKVGTPMPGEKADPGKEFIFSYGHKIEDLVLETFCAKTGAIIIPETRMFYNKKYPWVIANVDGICRFPADSIHPEERIYVLEAKTTTAYNEEHWKENKVPAYYVTQCHQYMSVLDDPRILGTWISVIYGNTIDCFRSKLIERDKERETTQLAEEEFFWKEYILAHKEPPYSGDAKEDSNRIRAMCGPADKSLGMMDLSDVFSECSAYVKANKIVKKLQEDLDRAKEIRDTHALGVQALMQQCTKGLAKLPTTAKGDTYFEVSWIPKKRTSVDTDLLYSKYPEVAEEVVSVNPENSRVFTIKERQVV